MLKFFRKIRQKLLQENKFGNYLKYAFSEIQFLIIPIISPFKGLDMGRTNDYSQDPTVPLGTGYIL